jgi:hypothetical protein
MNPERHILLTHAAGSFKDFLEYTGRKLQFQKNPEHDVTDRRRGRRQDQSYTPFLRLQAFEEEEEQQKGAHDETQSLEEQSVKEQGRHHLGALAPPRSLP